MTDAQPTSEPVGTLAEEAVKLIAAITANAVRDNPALISLLGDPAATFLRSVRDAFDTTGTERS